MWIKMHVIRQSELRDECDDLPHNLKSYNRERFNSPLNRRGRFGYIYNSDYKHWKNAKLAARKLYRQYVKQGMIKGDYNYVPPYVNDYWRV